MLTTSPMILEEEAPLPAAPKEAVAVAFICNLCGFGCLYLRTGSSPSQWHIGREPPREEPTLG